MINAREVILEFKKKRNAVVMAHYFQSALIKEIADYIGDSPELSLKAREIEEKVIVSCGPNYLAENIKILSPEKTVLQPEIFSDCSMLKNAGLKKELKKAKENNPEALVACDIKSPAVIKAESDITFTAANVIKILDSLSGNKIIFLGDKNLAEYVRTNLDKDVIAVNMACPVHDVVEVEDIERIKKTYPEAEIVVAQSCKAEVKEMADYVDGISGIIEFISSSKARNVAVGSEVGLLDKLKKDNPNKKIVLLSPKLVCQTMKRNNLYKTARALKNMETSIEIEEGIRLKAEHSLAKMMYYSKNPLF